MIKIISIQLSLIACSLILTGLLTIPAFQKSSAAFAQQIDSVNQFTLSTFAGGQRYVIQKDSFRPIGGGKLQYQVVEDVSNPEQGRRVSVNEVDCNTGQYRSPVESWYEDAQGNVSQLQPGPPFPMQVSTRTPLYGQLKSSCQESLPDLPINW